MANTASAIEFCNKVLVKACSKLRVEFIYKVWNNISMSTNSVTSVVDIEVIKQWLRKILVLVRLLRWSFACLSLNIF